MPLTFPRFSAGPYRFFTGIPLSSLSHRSEALAAVVPEPLEVVEPWSKYEFIRMPDPPALATNTETGSDSGRLTARRRLRSSMSLDDDARSPRARIVGFPKKPGLLRIANETDVLFGTLALWLGRLLSATMGYKQSRWPP